MNSPPRTPELLRTPEHPQTPEYTRSPEHPRTPRTPEHPRTPEYYSIIPRTPPPIRRDNTVRTPDTIIEEWNIPPPFFGDDDDATIPNDEATRAEEPLVEDTFEDFHFPAPVPLVRQNAVLGVHNTPPARVPPIGIAYEIHNYADNIQSEPVLSTLERITRKSRNTYTNVPDVDRYMKLHIVHNFISGIQGNHRYNEQEKERKARQFYQVFDTRIEPYLFTEDPIETQMIGLCVYYMLDFNKSDILRQLYIDTFLTDCIEAYSVAPGAEPLSGMSCTHGVIERLYTSVPQAIRQRLSEPNVGRYRMSNKRKKEYTTVLESFESHTRILAQINAAVIDWFDTIEEIAIPDSVVERKRLLTQHIVRYLNEHGFPNIREDSPEIVSYYSANAWLAISLSRNPPVMGGKKFKKSMNKKSMKTIRGEKSKRVKRQMGSATRKQKKNRKMTQKISHTQRRDHTDK